MTIFVFEYCLPDYAAGTETGASSIGSVSTFGSGGDFSMLISVPGELRIDNVSCTYQVRARFGSSGSSCNCDSQLVLKKVRAQFRLPAEGEVVPAAHPFFDQ